MTTVDGRRRLTEAELNAIKAHVENDSPRIRAAAQLASETLRTWLATIIWGAER